MERTLNDFDLPDLEESLRIIVEVRAKRRIEDSRVMAAIMKEEKEKMKFILGDDVYSEVASSEIVNGEIASEEIASSETVSSETVTSEVTSGETVGVETVDETAADKAEASSEVEVHKEPCEEFCQETCETCDGA